MAPEILLGEGHNKDADWWSVGVLLYEMITSKAPFIHNNRNKLYEKIIKDKIKLSPYLTSEAHSLLKGLLQKDPSTRLGSGPNGDEHIKNHKWFSSGQLIGTNWKQENYNQSLNHLMCLEKIAQLILIDAGRQCRLRTLWHQLLQQVTIFRAILMFHQILGFLLDKTENIQIHVSPNLWLSSR